MLDDRSPGERVQGSLASLKPKKQAAAHERALPKVRASAPPAVPFAMLAGPPVVPSIVAAPLNPLIAGVPPQILVPPVGLPGTPGGPVVLADVGGGGGGGGGGSGGGGGGVIVPPVTVPTQTIVPSVPEPSSWAMMLIGLALMA